MRERHFGIRGRVALLLLSLALLPTGPFGCGGSGSGTGAATPVDAGFTPPPGAVSGSPGQVVPTGSATLEEILDAGEVPTPETQPPLPGPDREAVPPADYVPPAQQEPVVEESSEPSAKIADGPSASAIAITHAFQALPQNQGSFPPDTNGAAGPNHLVTLLNTEMRIQDKQGNVLVPDVGLGTFFAPTGHADVFDPKIIFDGLSGRWIACAEASRRSAASATVLAVSATADPTGTWTFYSLDADPTDMDWADFPGIGVNGNWIVLTSNMFTIAADAFTGVRMMAIDKSTALAGGLLTVTNFFPGFDTAPFPFGFGTSTLKPCVHVDASFGGTLFLVDNFADVGGTKHYRLSFLTGPPGAAMWLPQSGGPFPGTGTFPAPFAWNSIQPTAPQMGGGANLDTGDTRISGEPMAVGGRIYFTHTGGSPSAAPTTTALFANEIRPDPFGAAVFDRFWGFTSMDGPFLHPSIAANSLREVALGASQSGPAIFPRAICRAAEGVDPGPFFPSSAVIKSGEDNYVLRGDTDPGPGCVPGRNRWGDYSATVLDPVDNRTFWTLQEYSLLEGGFFFTDCGGGTGRWSTWWARKSNFGPMSIAGADCGGAVGPLECNQSMPSGRSYTTSITASNPSGAPFQVRFSVDGMLQETRNVAGASPGPSMTNEMFTFVYSVGLHNVSIVADDGTGNVATCAFTVQVQDMTGPVLTPCPANITVECTGPGGAVVNYTAPTATDACEGPVAVTCVPPSGSMFPLGMTMVTCTATDSNMNSSMCTFTVTVQDTTPPVVTASASRTMLFLPRGGLYDSLLTYSVMDLCDPNPTKQVTVYSNIADTLVAPYTPDVVLVGPQLQVRADTDLSLAGPAGRVYLIVVTGTDHAMPMPNAASACTWVVVPKTATIGDILGVRNLALAAQAACPNPGPGPAPAQTPLTELGTTALP